MTPMPLCPYYPPFFCPSLCPQCSAQALTCALSGACGCALEPVRERVRLPQPAGHLERQGCRMLEPGELYAPSGGNLILTCVCRTAGRVRINLMNVYALLLSRLMTEALNPGNFALPYARAGCPEPQTSRPPLFEPCKQQCGCAAFSHRALRS